MKHSVSRWKNELKQALITGQLIKICLKTDRKVVQGMHTEGFGMALTVSGIENH